MKHTVILCLLSAVLRLDAGTVSLTVSAAASLKDPLETLKAEFEGVNPGLTVTCNFGSSGALRQQIASGAPVDVFISAASKQMDELEAAGLIVPESRFVLAGNEVVLISPAAAQAPDGFEGLSSAAIQRISIGEPKSVPAGMYAMQILEHFQLTDSVKEKLVYAKDVRQVLVYVLGGHVDAGIVYGSDAARSKDVRVVAAAPEDSHQKVEYPAAVVKASTHPAEAERFLAFLRSEKSAALFKSLGFVIHSPP